MLRKFSIFDSKIVEGTDADCQVYYYVNPDETEKKYLIDQLKIDEHTLISALDPNELARIEFEPEHVALIFKRPKRYSAKDNFLFKIESAGLFIFKDKLVVLLSEDIHIFDGRQFNKVNDIREVVLKLVYLWIVHFVEHLKVISMCSDELEKGINTSISNNQLLSMFKLEKSLVFYLEAISSNGKIINKLKVHAEKLNLSTANIEFLDDVYIENSQCYEMAQIYSQVLSSLMNARASMISNNLNVMMKNLNAIVIAIAIPSFFAGVGGMSEFSGMIGFENWKLGYFMFIIIMSLIGVVTFIIIKKSEQKWKDS
jgi:magnesium transporter